MNFKIYKKIPILALIFLFLSTSGAQAVLADSASSGSVAQNSGLVGNTSENWSGYVSAQNNASYTAVSGSWNIPSPDITTNSPIATDATWVGIGGVASHDLIQAGTQAVVQNGTVTYEAWLETLPDFQQILPITVNGGDAVSVSLNQTSPGEWQLTFNDKTNGQNYSEAVAYDSSLSSAEWIEEMPAGVTGRGGLAFLPLDNFGTVNFTGGGATINGNTETIAASGAQALTMVAGNEALATSSPLLTDGASFSVTRSDLAINTTEPQQTEVQIQVFGQGQGQSQSRGFRRDGTGMQGTGRGVRSGRWRSRELNIEFYQ
jgi:hypothetical protein